MFMYFLIFWQRFTEFGGPIYRRPVQDLAFAIARFIQKGGSFVNYYMVSLIFIALHLNQNKYFIQVILLFTFLRFDV